MAAVKVDEFYAADPRRRSSDELGLGDHWFDGDLHGVMVRWLEETGEVCVFTASVDAKDVVATAAAVVANLATAFTSNTADIAVDVLGVVRTREELDRVFEGWEAQMPTENSLDWVRSRVWEHSTQGRSARKTAMNIEEFYDADERRRASEEIELGRDWHDAEGKRYEVSWVVDTGEVYLMREPTEPIDTDPAFGTQFVEPMDVDTMTVEVLATVATPEELAERLAGWQDAMTNDDSIAWVRERLA